MRLRGLKSLLWCVANITLALVAAGACSKNESAPSISKEGAPEFGSLPTTRDPEAQNPDGNRHVDLRAHPFRKQWVGGTLRIARSAKPKTLNNLLWGTNEERVYAKYFLYPFLLIEVPDRVDGVLKLEPCAAEALPTAHADGRTWSYRLRKDLSFEDGTALTAHDYAFTWTLLQSEDPDLVRATEQRRGTLERIASVTATDDHTIEVKFKEPYYNHLVTFGLEFTVVPKHVVTSDREAFLKQDRHLAYGPYRLLHYDENVVRMELRKEYRDRPSPFGPHYVETVEFHFVRDAAVQLEKTRAGEIDVTAFPQDRFALLQSDQRLQASHWQTYYFLASYLCIWWNLRDPEDFSSGGGHPLFRDSIVRRALSHLVPRDRLVVDAFDGLARITSGPFFYLDAGYNHDVAPITFDPKAARTLLADAGWVLNKEGILEKAGRSFRFEMLVNQSTVIFNQIATAMAEEARRIGIDMIVRKQEWNTAIYPRLQERRFDAVLAINSVSPAIESDLYELLHSKEVGQSTGNTSSVSEPRIDALIDGYRSAVAFEERSRLRRELHRVFDEIQPWTILFNAPSCIAISRRFANVKVHDLGIWYRDFVLRELWERFPPERSR